MIKIVEGTKEEFEDEVNKLEKLGFLPVPKTHCCFEYCGKIYYSVVTIKGEEKND